VNKEDKTRILIGEEINFMLNDIQLDVLWARTQQEMDKINIKIENISYKVDNCIHNLLDKEYLNKGYLEKQINLNSKMRALESHRDGLLIVHSWIGSLEKNNGIGVKDSDENIINKKDYDRIKFDENNNVYIDTIK
jgi:hypothetical protein